MNGPIVLIYPEMDSSSPFGMGKPLLPPLGLSFLAAYLQKAGYTSSIIDNTIEQKSHDEILRRIQQLKPILIGLQCLSVNYQPCLRLAEKLKSSLDTPIVVGGPHATIMPETLQKPCIDFICVGEGEETLLALANGLKSSKKIAGLWSRQDDQWVWGGPRGWISNLSSLPHPLRSIMLEDLYPRRVGELSAYPVLAVNSSRGCPYSCRFCSVENVWGRQYRSFSAEWVLEELKRLIKVHHAKGVYFYEDNFTAQQKRVSSICEGVFQKGYQIEWACEGRIGSLPLTLLKMMKQAGCQTIKFGIESGSPRVLELMDKKLDLNEALSTRADCGQAGIRFSCFILVGFPGETEGDRQLTLDFVKKLRPDHLVLNRFIPVPKSWAYQQLVDTYGMDSNYMLYPRFDEQEHLMSWVRRIDREGSGS